MRTPASSMRSARALVLCVTLLLPAASAQETASLEYQVNAVFLLRIAQFIEWPARPAQPALAPFIIGVIGEDPFGPLLDQVVAGEHIAGRPIVVRRFPGPENLGASDLLVVASSERAATERVLKRVAGVPTLTVADFEGFVGQGGAVEFYLHEGRVRFRIDRRAAEAAGLRLRSQLLRAAALVKDD